MRGTTSFTDIISSQGKVPSSEVLSYTKTAPNDVECEKLNITKKRYDYTNGTDTLCG